MIARHWKKVAFCGGGACLVASGLTLRARDYDINSLGLLRLGRAAFTAAKIATHYKTKLYSSNLDPSSTEYNALRSEVHREAAEMLLKLCCKNKGVYIKVGQHLASLDYLVPAEYIKVMKVLHSDAPKSSLKSVYKVLREDLKQEPSEIFEYFEEEPLGTASLAQVHKARLKKDGSLVAVKVQHALVKNNSKADMRAMEILVGVMSSIFEEFNFQWLVDETKLNLPKELDFINEAKNAEKVKELFCGLKWLKIPDVHWNLTTSRILTMEFEEGVQVTNINYINENKIDRMVLSSRLGELYSNMIFKYGFVHSDPHPGNILIKQNEDNKLDIVLLDHGLYASLSEEFRWNYSKFWLSILNRDMAGMRENSKKLGIDDLYLVFICMVTGRTLDAVTGGINKVKYSDAEKEQFVNSVPILLSKIGEILQTVNREMLLILKTNDLLRGIEHSLSVHKRQPSFLIMTKCCVESIYEERLRICQSTVKRCYLQVCKHWTILKLNLYYMFLNVKSKLVTE
ncbi:hypothetical protein RUM43_010536 [Polyplax serrata]|uniref:Protein kinase domain-containing protein n=2 Tax=Polyplax serrata TaxID=468196 RepID=A0AAN8PKZ5_POLSC